MRFPLTLLAALLSGACLMVPPPAATAGEGWQTLGPSRVRLLGAGHVDAALLAGRSHLPNPVLLAGVEIKLRKGWKTYWRTPGDGIAPQFIWNGSRNVAATQVLWPVPRYFRDTAGEYNGYEDRVIFPVLIAPGEAGAPVRLSLSLEYAVCADICVPISATLSSTVTAEAPKANREAVMAAVERTPLRADESGRCLEGPAFADMDANLKGKTPYLEITIAHPESAPPSDLFIESEDGAFLPHPKAQGKSDTRRTVYRLDLGENGDPEAFSGQTMTLTAVGPQQGCEMAWTVK